MAAALLRMSRGAQRWFLSGKPAALRRTIHTSVWWDMNTVEVPEDWDLTSVAGTITNALAELNYSGPVTFSAYVCKYNLLDEEISALSSTGINLTDAYYYWKDPTISSKLILQDIWFWTKDHPPPANCLFITGDADLSFALHKLAMRRYNILLAKSRELGQTEAAATAVWRWKGLLAGYPPESTN